MTRGFQKVSVAAHETGFSIRLDGQPVMTPAKRPLAAPTRALAEAIAGEWSAQGSRVAPETMPLTRLANIAIDRADAVRAALIEEVARHAQTDLLCHRADHPQTLVVAQTATWGPLLDWMRAAMGAELIAVAGVAAIDQPPASLDAVRARAQALGPWRLTGLAHGVGLTGSAVIACALEAGRLGADDAFAAAFLDELWQLQRWGEDAEARARLDRLRAEITALEAWFLSLAPAD